MPRAKGKRTTKGPRKAHKKPKEWPKLRLYAKDFVDDETCPLCKKQRWSALLPDHGDYCQCMICYACGLIVPDNDETGELSIGPTDELGEEYGDFPRCMSCWDKLEQQMVDQNKPTGR